MTKSPQRTDRLVPEQKAAIRRIQRLALVILVAAAIGTIVPFTEGLWQATWQNIMALAGGFIAVMGMAIAIFQSRTGHLTRAGWIMIGSLLTSILLSSLAIAGIGLILGMVAVLLVMLIAELTLTSGAHVRAIVFGVTASTLFIVIDAIDLPGRITIPGIDVVLLLATVLLAVLFAVILIRRFPNFTLRGKLIVVSLTVSLVPLAIVGVLFAASTQQRAIDDVNQSLKAAANDTASNLDEFIQTGLDDVSVAAQIPELVNLLEFSNRDAPEYAAAENRAVTVLRALSHHDPIFLDSLAVLDQDGTNLLDTNSVDKGSSEALRDYFVDPVADGLPYVSPVTIAPNTDRASITFSAPIRSSAGKILGVLRTRYDAAVLHERIFSSKALVGAQSGATLLDENNIILADALHPHHNLKVMGEPNFDKVTRLRDQKRLPVLPADELIITSPEYERGLAQANLQPTFTAREEGINETEQVAVASMTARPWRIAFARPQAEFLDPINQQNRLIIFGGLAVILVIAGIAVLAAQAIARPVTALTTTAQQVSQGDFTARVPVMSQDEIGTLAVTFNSMTEQLSGMLMTLEDRVQARTDQLRASAEVGHAATSILDPDQLLRQTVELITNRFGFYYTAVFVLDEENQMAVLRAATGEAGSVLLERGHHLVLNEASMVGGAIITGRARVALDVGEGAVRFANPLLPNTRSEIALPLRVGDRPLGALDVQSEQPGAFDESSTEVLQTMADQVAVALFNAETFKRSEEQTYAMTQLNQLSRNLATATSLEDIALTVQPVVTNLLGQSSLAIIQKTANPQILALREFTPDRARPVGDSELIQAAHSLIGECVERGEVIYAPDLSQLADRYSDVGWFYELGLRSGVALPLRVGERILGAFNVSAEQTNAYSVEQLTQLEQVASQLAVTVENLNLAEQTQQTLAELDAANRQLIGQAWEQHTRTAQLEAAEWNNGTWRLVNDRAARAGTATSLRLPLKVRGATIGEFNITGADAQRDWDPEELNFAQALIDQVGQVLETARLLDETERVAQREKAVADAADKIHRSTDIQSVLQSAVAELQRITGRQGIRVQLGFGATTHIPKRATTAGAGAVVAAGNGQAARPEGDRSNA